MAEIGYCVKCKAKKEMKDTQKVTIVVPFAMWNPLRVPQFAHSRVS